jgi:sugar lactone lactonase YvrE
MEGLSWAPGNRLFGAEMASLRILGVDLTTGTIATIAGGGSLVVDNVPATSISLFQPVDAFFASPDSVYLSTLINPEVRRVSLTTGLSERVAGVGAICWNGDGLPATSTCLSQSCGVVVDASGNIYISDTFNHRIRRVDAATHLVSTHAGTGTAATSGNGVAATAAGLYYPEDLALAGNGDLYITERSHWVRRIDASTGLIWNVAGTGEASYAGEGVPALTSPVSSPNDVAFDNDGNLFIAEAGSFRVRRIDRVSGLLATVAGNGADPGTSIMGDFGPAADASLRPSGLAFDATDNLFISDRSWIRRVDAATQVITTIGGAVYPLGDGTLARTALGTPWSLSRIDEHTLWLADGQTGRLRAVDTLAGELVTVVGYPDGDSGEGVRADRSRLLRQPFGLVYLAAAEQVIVSEQEGHVLRAVDLSATPATVTTFAGVLDEAGHVDGPAGAARFNRPAGLAADASGQRLWVADSGNHCVRMIDLTVSPPRVSTVAGTPQERGFWGEGTAASTALFNGPLALAATPAGDLYVADTDNHRARVIDSLGVVTTVLGDGTPASSGEGSPAWQFPIDSPAGLVVDTFGNLFVSSRSAVRRVSAGADGRARGDDAVATIYGAPPADQFPESVTFCLTGMLVRDGPAGEAAASLLVLDRCQGFLLELSRQP